MTTPVSGQISLLDIKNVFNATGANANIYLSDFYLNAVSGFMTGVAGIPSIGAEISLSQFYGKSKPTGFTWPTKVATNRGNYIPEPFGTGSDASYEWLTGAKGENNTTLGGSTFNNLNSQGRFRASGIDYSGEILQARRGDRITITAINGTQYGDPEYIAVIMYAGQGQQNYISGVSNASQTFTLVYDISPIVTPGSYGMYVYNFYSSPYSQSGYQSWNFYSLHIVA